MLGLLAGFLLVAIYFGRPMLERVSEDLSTEEERVVPEDQQEIVVTNDRGAGELRPLVEKALEEIEEADVTILYMGLHDELEQMVIDYRVRGDSAVMEVVLVEDEYGRLHLMRPDDSRAKTIYPPKGFKGLRE